MPIPGIAPHASSRGDGGDELNKLMHDIRSPLGTMKIWIHLLRTGTMSSEEQARALEALLDGATAIEELIDRVLPAHKPATSDS